MFKNIISECVDVFQPLVMNLKVILILISDFIYVKPTKSNINSDSEIVFVFFP